MAKLTLSRQFRLLMRSPVELQLLFLANLLNSFKYFGMALILPLIASSEYGLSDVEAGGLYGAWGLLITLWGVVASVVVDSFGVRNAAMLSAAVSVASRALLVFCRSNASLFLTVYLLAPFGDALFDPCFLVGIKRLTTDVTRPFAFACAYTVMNLGGALSDNLADIIRTASFTLAGQHYSGLRAVLLATLVACILNFFVCFSLRDLSEVEAEQVATQLRMTPGSGTPVAVRRRQRQQANGGGPRRMDSPRWLSSVVARGETRKTEADGVGWRPTGPAVPAPAATPEECPAPRPDFVGEVRALCGNVNFWRVVVFITSVLFVSQQWRFLDLLMPKFVIRYFGEDVPFANLASINLWGCVFLPPLVATHTSHIEDIALIQPGLWIMALAPAVLIFNSSVGSVALWITVMTIGEVIWSPRSSSYAASMAPYGREAVFLAICSWPTYLTKYPAGIFSGWLLEKYVPPCHSCPVCTGLPGDPDGCLQSCSDCPDWDGSVVAAKHLWIWVFGMAIVSPIMVSLLAPWLRRPDFGAGYSRIPDAASPGGDATVQLPAVDLEMVGSTPSYQQPTDSGSKRDKAFKRSSSSSNLI